ncbi:uncharacterized protein LOC127712212 [Mytilus californianus]|uniref:uncharacterized protein LOC127712212 n=1 Tax=Mytilus californianus TaxID=6549 RepID=UPI002245F448|nr:uncharacterized protein LOC127712212 [Mytilus californianus]
MVSNLVDHYRQLLDQTDGVDVSNIEPEWTILKNLLYKNHKVHEMNWSTINDLYQDKCANALNVIDLVLSLPAGTSECERGFSQMKIIKNQWRNKLKSTSMTLLMTIQLHSDPITQFNPEHAIHQWNKGARRRPNFMQKKVKKTVVQQMEEIMNVIEDETQELTNTVDNLETAASCPDKAADSDNDSCFSDMEEGFYSGDEIGTGSDRSDID